MKPLVKKILEAGLVDEHTARMLEKWGALEPGASSLAGRQKATRESLEELAEDIVNLLEEDEDKETHLEIRVEGPPLMMYTKKYGLFGAAVDAMGRLIVSPRIELTPGMKVWPEESKEWKGWTVLEVEKVHRGDLLVAYQVTVEKPE